jgi:hypothetical protein
MKKYTLTYQDLVFYKKSKFELILENTYAGLKEAIISNLI